MARRRTATVTNNFLDLRTNSFEADAKRFKRFGRDPFAFVDQPEQDVLRADVVVIQEAGFLLCEDNNPPGSIGKAFEHVGNPSVDES